jgi:hypothetical protein
MTGLFGPQNANAATTLPPTASQQRYGANQTWVQDCSGPGRNDGTVLDAAFYNRIIGNLDYLISTSGITATPGDMSALYRAVLGAVSVGAPALLNTLSELAAAIGDDPNFASTMLNSLSMRLRFDGYQYLSAQQRLTALSNMGVTLGVSANNVVQLDGAAKLPAVDGSQLTNVTVTWGNVTGKPVIGTGPNNLVQLDASAKLPAVDGSQLTNVVAAVTGAVVYNAAQSLTDAQRLQALANVGIPMECGRLTFNSATALKYLPYKGDLLKINGSVFRIPSTGIAGLANTGVYVGGVSGQNLAASTVYYVYAFMNGTTMTADFSTTGHSSSSTAGNVGTEIKTGDDTRSLIGMISTNASGQFQDSSTNCGVLSWFNRRRRVLTPGQISLAAISSPTWVELSASSLRLTLLVWGEDSGISVTASGDVVCSTSANAGFGIGIDSTSSPSGGVSNAYFNNSNHNSVDATAAVVSTSEGSHYVTLLGGVNAGTVTYNSTTIIATFTG